MMYIPFFFLSFVNKISNIFSKKKKKNPSIVVSID